MEAAVIALDNMHDKEALVPLTGLLNHENREIRIYAQQAIKNLQSANSEGS